MSEREKFKTHFIIYAAVTRHLSGCIIAEIRAAHLLFDERSSVETDLGVPVTSQSNLSSEERNSDCRPTKLYLLYFRTFSLSSWIKGKQAILRSSILN